MTNKEKLVILNSMEVIETDGNKTRIEISTVALLIKN